MNGLLTLAVPKQTCAEINLVHTSTEGTRAAWAFVGSLSRDLDIRIRVLAFQVVPHRLSMTQPPVPPDFVINEILQILNPCDPSLVTLEYALCRNREESILRRMRKPATVVLGGRNTFIPSEEERLARHLKAEGYDVFFAPVEGRFWPKWFPAKRLSFDGW